MTDSLATIIAALIGALIGSIGAVFLEFWLSSRAKEKQTRQIFAQKYLFHLQDAAESLWWRIDTLAVWHNELKENSYFEFTTLYALGKVLASERMLVLDGIYPLLNVLYPGLTNSLRNNINRAVGEIGLKQYDRILLAETLIMSVDGNHSLSTYLDFQKKYKVEDQREREWIDPARNGVQALSDSNVRKIVSDHLYEVVKEISKKIGVKSSLP